MWPAPRSVLVTMLVLVGAASATSADEAETKPTYRAVLDRAELEPSAIGGHRLSVYLSAMSLQGQILDLTDPKTIKAYVGSTELKAPFALGSYGATTSETAIVVVVQSTVEYAEVLPVIAEALEQAVLNKLTRVQLAVLTYGEAIGAGKLGPLKAAQKAISSLQTDNTAGEPALLDTLERGLALLKKARTEPEGRALRKMVLVIGDGRDKSGDRERVTRLGTRAAREGVRIHSFAYSPTDVRRPLLLLGELSKRSLGTFRWVRSGKSDSWTAAFQQLLAEIESQYVVTYFVEPDADLAGKKLKIVTAGRAAVTSNELKIPPLGCNDKPCDAGYCAANQCVQVQAAGGRGIVGWILLVGGIGAGAIVILGLIGFLMSRRQPPIALPPGVAPPVKAPKSRPPKNVPQAVLPSAPPVVAAPVTTGPRLYILTGPRTGETIALKHGFSIGKTPENDLVIDDGYTSSTHAQIGVDHFGNCSLYDRGSTNGTYVNGVRVTEYALQHGVSLRIGSIELRFLAQ